MTATVAFLGLGRMGTPMAERLLAAEYPVTVWNRTPARVLSLAARGAEVAATPAAAAAAAKIVILMLADPAAVDAVLDGTAGVLAGLRPDTVVVDCSTVGPSRARRSAERVEAAGGRFVEAPVLGSIPAAEQGTLTVLAGGRDEDVALVDSVLRVFGTVVRTGPVGTANTLKLAMNLLVGGITELLAEAIVLAERSGLAPAVMRQTLATSVLRSPFLDYKAPQLFERRFTPLFTTALMAKDFELLLAHAAEVGLDLPAASVIGDAYHAAAAGPHRDDDFAAVIDTVDSR